PDMLKRILDSELVSEDSKRSGRFWTEPLRTLISSLTFVILLPIGLAAQASPQAAVYGSGIQAPLQFAGESAPVNQVSLSMGTSVLYDGDVFATSSHGFGDEAFSVNSHRSFTRQSEHLTASLDYMPFFLFYRTFD